MIPETPWRFGERYLVIDFITPNNISIVDAVKALVNEPLDVFIENVAKWIRDEFIYPFDSQGNPSAQGQLLRNKTGFTSYLFKKCVDYMWSLPNETVLMEAGICIDTSNLVESVLRNKLVDAWCVLGSVKNSITNEILGYHAWIEVPYRGILHVLETTIHEMGIINLVKAEEIYDGSMDVYYVPMAHYNEEAYNSSAEIIRLMGPPIQPSGIFKKVKPNIRLWKKQYLNKMRKIQSTFKHISD